MASAPTEVPAAARFVINTKGQWLRADFAAAYLRAQKAGCPAGGVSGMGAGRTKQDQEYLHDQYLHHGGPLAAWPWYTSNHIDGTALDITTGTAAQRWLSQGGRYDRAVPGEKIRANEFGLIRTVNGARHNEPWHFAYDRSKDRHRAADLAARLKALGFSTVAAFQTSAGLKPDGVDGPLTWSALLKTQPIPEPVPDPVPPSGATDLRMATFNVWSYAAPPLDDRLEAIVATIAGAKAPLVALTECPESYRDGIRAGLPGGAGRWKVRPREGQAILFDDEFVEAGDDADVLRVRFGPTDMHGGVAERYVIRSTGLPVVVGAFHLPPDKVSTHEFQRKALARFAGEMRTLDGVRIMGGDGANGPDWAPGWLDVRLSAKSSTTRDRPTYRPTQSITDRILSDSTTPVSWRGYTVRSSRVKVKGKLVAASDHDLVVVAGTVVSTPTG